MVTANGGKSGTGAAPVSSTGRDCTRSRAKIAGRVHLLAARGIIPGLAVVLVERQSGIQHLRQKQGPRLPRRRHSFGSPPLPGHRIGRGALDCICSLNAKPTIHGVLVQLPLPKSISIRRILKSISISKDVDGFHLFNVGGLVIGETVFPPCTPYGVQKLLEHEGISVEGKNVTVVGASNIVGKPLALMLMQREATVAICHAKTRDLTQYTILADLLVVAAGCPNLIVPQMVKTGAIVIDVGINRTADGRLVGDVDFEGVRQKASLITPVPGGVGPMTVTMLLENTVRAAERANNIDVAVDQGILGEGERLKEDDLAAQLPHGNPFRTEM